jgi:hypothetical protein
LRRWGRSICSLRDRRGISRRRRRENRGRRRRSEEEKRRRGGRIYIYIDCRCLESIVVRKISIIDILEMFVLGIGDVWAFNIC